jgi:hypothetical protein
MSRHNPLATAHTSSSLTHSYTIDVTIFVVEKLEHKCTFLLPRTRGKFLKDRSERNTDQTIHNFNLNLCLLKVAEAVKRP